MANFYDDNADLQFYVEHGIPWGELAANAADAQDLARDTLELLGSFAADEVAPRGAEIDRHHPRLVNGEVELPQALAEVHAGLRELELHGLAIPEELGGIGAPVLLFQLASELLARADVSVCAHHGFHGGMALAALALSIREGSTQAGPDGTIAHTRFERCIRSIVAGEEWGSMDITESDAGSDMAALRCRARQSDSGHWFLTGQKVFITSGHGRWHFVIARTEEAGDPDDPLSGLGGLSMFLVEAFTRDERGQPVRTHTSLDALEDKLGHNGSATVAISFDDAPAELIGNRGDGFRYMLILMNGARVGVGFESLGLCEAAYRAALAYAQQRPSMGKTIDQHEMIADYLDEMRTHIQGIRALAVSAGLHDEIAKKAEIELALSPPADPTAREALEKRLRKHSRRARKLTPLLKYIASEQAVAMAQRAVQIHGGAGYITEYGVEKLLRDAMVLPIYEGTSQIQALMAMKDTLVAAVKHPQRFLQRQARIRWRANLASDPLERRVARLQRLEVSAVQHLLSRLATSKLEQLRSQPISSWRTSLTDFDPKRDFARAMLHAERLCVLRADVAVAEELLEQVEAHPSRHHVLERWLERAEPRCRAMLDQIQNTGQRLLDELHGAPDTLEQAAR